MRQTARFIISQFPDVTITIDSLIADGDDVAARVTARGTNHGPIGGHIPPTGRAFVAAQVHWFRVKEGKLAEHWAVRDDLTAMLQLGVLKPPSSALTNPDPARARNKRPPPREPSPRAGMPSTVFARPTSSPGPRGGVATVAEQAIALHLHEE